MSRSRRSSFSQKTIKGHRHAEVIEPEDVEIRQQLEEEALALQEDWDEECCQLHSDWDEYQSDLYFEGDNDDTCDPRDLEDDRTPVTEEEWYEWEY